MCVCVYTHVTAFAMCRDVCVGASDINKYKCCVALRFPIRRLCPAHSSGRSSRPISAVYLFLHRQLLPLQADSAAAPGCIPGLRAFNYLHKALLLHLGARGCEQSDSLLSLLCFCGALCFFGLLFFGFFFPFFLLGKLKPRASRK